MGDAVVEPGGAKERALLARLVLGVGATVSVADLVDSLWGSEPPATAAKSLQSHVMRLRNALEPGRTGFSSVLVTEGRGYRLDVPPDQVDAEEFVRLARPAARSSPPPAGRGRGNAALRAPLWCGPAYVGVDAPVVLAAARRLDDLRVAALEDRLAAELDLGHAPESPPSSNSSSSSTRTGNAPGGCWCPPSTATAASVTPWRPTRAAGRCWSTRWASSPGRAACPARTGARAGPDADWPRRPGRGSRRPGAGGRSAGGSRRRAGRAARLLGRPVRQVPAAARPARPARLRHQPAGGRPGDHVAPGRRRDAGPAERRRPGRARPTRGDAGRGPPGATLVLARADRAAPPGAEVLDLAPLPPSLCAPWSASYVGRDRGRGDGDVALRESGGWPGAVHAEALGLARGGPRRRSWSLPRCGPGRPGGAAGSPARR